MLKCGTDQEINKIFVYGTLKVGGKLSGSFNDYRKNVRGGKTKGILYKVSGAFFPAIKLCGDKYVYGEIHEYGDFENILKRFDRIEGYSPERKRESLYTREIVSVETENGIERAYIYEFNHSCESFEEVENGNWEV